jgi:hypothetical protein
VRARHLNCEKERLISACKIMGDCEEAGKRVEKIRRDTMSKGKKKP